ncbi:F-box associated domain containing protein [Tanacetum coccineum]
MTLEIAHWFPPEIIREILLKLPVESLLRCKSVSKDWYSLISDQNFIKTHYTLSSTNNINYAQHRLIYNTFDQKINLISCPLYDVLFHKSVSNMLLLENPLQRPQFQWAGINIVGINIVGSCNGLVCLCARDYDDNNDLFIYNPSTRIWNELPFCNRKSQPDRYSFVYDESTDDYKIVELDDFCFGNRPNIIKWKIYSLKTGKWRNIGDFPYEYNYPLNCCGIFSNGALHWVACDESSTQRIVSLDLAKEIYGQVVQFEYDKGDLNMSLGVLGECLCGLCYYYESHADLWVMKVYGVKDSWTKLASFSYLTDPWIGLCPGLLFISDDGKVLFNCYSKLVIYNSKDSSSPKKIEYTDKFSEACIVVESLISPLGSRKGKSASMASSTRGEPTSIVTLTSLNQKEFNNMTSESYWLSRIRESEEVAMHHISLGFFKLALEAGCQNIKQLRDELESYDCRHNLLGLGKSAKKVFQSYHMLLDIVIRLSSNIPVSVFCFLFRALPFAFVIRPSNLHGGLLPRLRRRSRQLVNSELGLIKIPTKVDLGPVKLKFGRTIRENVDSLTRTQHEPRINPSRELKGWIVPLYKCIHDLEDERGWWVVLHNTSGERNKLDVLVSVVDVNKLHHMEYANGNLVLQIGNLKTGKEMWEAIKTSNLGDDRVKEARLQALITEFDNLKMSDNDTLEQVLDLKTTGFEDEVGLLKAYEERVKEEDKANDPQENLLYAKTEYSNGNNVSSGGRGRDSYSRGCRRGRGQGRGQGYSQNQGQRNSSKNHEDNEQKGKQLEKRDLSHIQCYHCDQYEHFVSKCPKRNRIHEVNLNETQEKGVYHEEGTFYMMNHIQETIFMNKEKYTPPKSESNTSDEDDAWYFDNGASNHITCNYSYFSKLNENITGHVRDGSDGISIP